MPELRVHGAKGSDDRPEDAELFVRDGVVLLQRDDDAPVGRLWARCSMVPAVDSCRLADGNECSSATAASLLGRDGGCW